MNRKYWKRRAGQYNNLDWVKNQKGINLLIKCCDFEKTHSVLDAGCGTGIIAQKISSKAGSVSAIDNSLDMLNQAVNFMPNIFYSCYDMSKLGKFCSNSFERVICRMSLHHLTKNALKRAMKGFYRLLKPQGKIIIEEGIPTHPKLGNFYKSIFSLKEKRLFFDKENLARLLTDNNFKIINTQSYISKIGLFNWLNNGELLHFKIDKIISLFVNSPPEIKNYYNLKIKNNEIYIDAKQIILVGQK